MNKIENLNFNILFNQDVFKQPNVLVVHYNNKRNWKQLCYYPDNYALKGIPCAVGIIDSNNPKVLSLGVSICSLTDNYNKKIARSIAYARARYTIGTTYHIQEILDNYIREYDSTDKDSYLGFDMFRDFIRNNNNKNRLTFYDLSLAAILNYTYRKCGTTITPWYSIINQLDYQIFDEYNKHIQ